MYESWQPNARLVILEHRFVFRNFFFFFFSRRASPLPHGRYDKQHMEGFCRMAKSDAPLAVVFESPGGFVSKGGRGRGKSA